MPSFYILPDLKIEMSINKNINVATTDPISIAGILHRTVV